MLLFDDYLKGMNSLGDMYVLMKLALITGLNPLLSDHQSEIPSTPQILLHT